MGRALDTDLFELTMAASHLQHGMVGPATFSLLVRRLPPRQPQEDHAKWPRDLFRARRRTGCAVPTSVSIRGRCMGSHLPGAPSNGRKFRIAGLHRLERLDQDR
jgi:hypothetical protein